MLLTRRRFFGFLAASPLAGQEFAPAKPDEALNVMDFEAAARKVMPPAHFGYIETGVDDDMTLEANRAAYGRYQLRTRRLVDVTRVSTSVELFGVSWDTPIMIAPVGSQRGFHPDGELATARAGASRKTLQILSTATTTSVEDVTRAATRPIWYQLYATDKWAVTEKLVKRAESAGCPVLVITVDLPAGRNTETEKRFKRLDARPCASCHGNATLGRNDYFRRKPMFDGIDTTGMNLFAPALTWESVDRIRRMTTMKVVLKGITTREDAILCREHGVDGIVVSNHGGRAEESNRSSLECLPEVLDACGGKIPVLLDGGIRRGTDIFKALALGARAVGIGRPYLWGLGAFGQAGVEAVLDILRRELELAMKQCGTRSLGEITAQFVTNSPLPAERKRG